jgi:predicted metalloprotease
MDPARWWSGGRHARWAAAGLATLGVLLAGCADRSGEPGLRPSPTEDGARRSTAGPAPAPQPTTLRDDASASARITGTQPERLARLTAAAVDDLEAFWAAEFPARFGTRFEPVGGFVAATPSGPAAPCAASVDAVAGNAYFCSTRNVIVWDAADLLPRLLRDHGDLAVAVVLAHEYGHVVQHRAGLDAAGRDAELQADCLAGAWVGRVRSGGSANFGHDPVALDRAVDGFVEFRDRRSEAPDDTSHGPIAERQAAFRRGLDAGTAACVE